MSGCREATQDSQALVRAEARDTHRRQRRLRKNTKGERKDVRGARFPRAQTGVAMAACAALGCKNSNIEASLILRWRANANDPTETASRTKVLVSIVRHKLLSHTFTSDPADRLKRLSGAVEKGANTE